MPDQLFALPQPAPAEAPVVDIPTPRWSYADVTERLLAEFGARHGLKAVSDVVRHCQTGEDGVRRLIAPESLEALARARLSEHPPVIAEPAP